MKKFIILFYLGTIIALGSCKKTNHDIDLNAIGSPTAVAALMTITNDNTGKVTIMPKGENVTTYDIDFGDNSEVQKNVKPGTGVNHIYKEGQFNVTITAYTINGTKTSSVEKLTVSFLPPKNLQANVQVDPADSKSVLVSAKADLETYFEVYFGDVANETPKAFMEGETIKHTYANAGTYKVKVIARSGGAAQTTTETEVKIVEPIELPLDFESTTLQYSFTNFGGANTSVIANPKPTGNASTKVAELVKNAGSEVWAGSFITLKDAINFSATKKIKIKAWSPRAGITVKMKLENVSDNNLNTEVDVVNTKAGEWEDLIFDFSNANLSNPYQRIVIFFDFGNAGTGASYYFDDVEMYLGPEVLKLPVDFESATLPYVFTNFGGANSSVMDNPSKTGINTSSKVGALLKTNGSEVWAGSFLELAQPINFDTFKKIKMNVYAPKANIVVKMKLENLANPNLNKEVDVVNTKANEWETLTFDFTGATTNDKFQRLVVFFDFGNPGADKTYYFDAISPSN